METYYKFLEGRKPRVTCEEYACADRGEYDVCYLQMWKMCNIRNNRAVLERKLEESKK